MNLNDKASLPGRREFGKMAVGGALGGVLAGSAASAARAPLPKWAPGIKISVQSPIDPTDDDLLFAQQLGTEYVTIEPRSNIEPTAENYVKWRDRYASVGIKVWNIGNGRVHSMEEVTLNLPGRDAKIEEYLEFLNIPPKPA